MPLFRSKSSNYRFPPGLEHNLLWYAFRKFRPHDPIHLFQDLAQRFGDIAHYKIGPEDIVFLNQSLRKHGILQGCCPAHAVRHSQKTGIALCRLAFRKGPYQGAFKARRKGKYGITALAAVASAPRSISRVPVPCSEGTDSVGPEARPCLGKGPTSVRPQDARISRLQPLRFA